MNQFVVGMGEALWDVLPEGKKIGGAPANFAYHISQFGFNSYVVSAVGADDLGNEIYQNFDDKQLNYIMPQVAQPTGTVLVSLDGEGIPQYEIKEDAAWDNIPFTPELEKLARQTRVVCFGSLAQRNEVSNDTINRFLDVMPSDEGVYKIFDINLRQHFYEEEVLRNSMCKANILKINDDELEIVSCLFAYTETTQEDQCHRLLHDFNLKMLILTCGTKGSPVFSGNHHSFVETPVVSVADTVGAGDSFTATFISSLLHDHSLSEAHALAVKISAFVCTQHGAMPILPPEYKKNVLNSKV